MPGIFIVAGRVDFLHEYEHDSWVLPFCFPDRELAEAHIRETVAEVKRIWVDGYQFVEWKSESGFWIWRRAPDNGFLSTTIHNLDPKLLGRRWFVTAQGLPRYSIQELEMRNAG